MCCSGYAKCHAVSQAEVVMRTTVLYNYAVPVFDSTEACANVQFAVITQARCTDYTGTMPMEVAVVHLRIV
jgi:hypothetical protein